MPVYLCGKTYALLCRQGTHLAPSCAPKDCFGSSVTQRNFKIKVATALSSLVFTCIAHPEANH